MIVLHIACQVQIVSTASHILIFFRTGWAQLNTTTPHCRLGRVLEVNLVLHWKGGTLAFG